MTSFRGIRKVYLIGRAARMTTDEQKNTPPVNFIHAIIDEHNLNGRFGGKVVTRFPPEPNGYLHIGHAKAICINFGTAKKYGGRCHLRFDDTNPLKESEEYAQSIIDDIRWLGFDWGSHLYHASDYFERIYESAVALINIGKAYVCDLTADEVKTYRGTLTEPGKNSPYRERSVAENLELFRKMRAGEFPDGHCTLRAKIDMSAGNINMRDPALYRIRRAHHIRTGDQWCIYPMYDFTHCLSDAFEGITHSLCSLEFQDHRPLYDWFLNELETENHPQQIEFARLNPDYTITSKRKLKQLVDEGIVNGWDDPRMPTIRGLRRRGFPPAAIRDFCDRIGVTKKFSVHETSYLEECVREYLNEHAARAFGVLRPLKVVIESYEENREEVLEAPTHPNDESRGKRRIPFTRELYIEQDDFMEDAPKDFFRLAPGREVRLRNSYVIKCERIIKDAAGKVMELRCSHDANTLGKNPEGRKVKGIIHWLSAKHAVPAEIRLYDRLFDQPDLNAVERDGGTFLKAINENSLEVLPAAFVEPDLVRAKPEETFQFERLGYFTVDKDSAAGKLVFNRTVTLRDSWAKVNK
jgi:glutaminyl-tRNA synthetase